MSLPNSKETTPFLVTRWMLIRYAVLHPIETWRSAKVAWEIEASKMRVQRFDKDGNYLIKGDDADD